MRSDNIAAYRYLYSHDPKFWERGISLCMVYLEAKGACNQEICKCRHVMCLQIDKILGILYWTMMQK